MDATPLERGIPCSWLPRRPKPGCPDLADAARAVSRVLSSGVLPATLEFLDQRRHRRRRGQREHRARPRRRRDADLRPGRRPRRRRARHARMAEVCRGRARPRRGSRPTRRRRGSARGAPRGDARARAPRAATILEDATVPRSGSPRWCEASRRSPSGGPLIGDVRPRRRRQPAPDLCSTRPTMPTVERVHRAFDEIFDAAIARDGTITGEHGVGARKLQYLEQRARRRSARAAARHQGTRSTRNGLLNPGKPVLVTAAAISRPPAAGCSRTSCCVPCISCGFCLSACPTYQLTRQRGLLAARAHQPHARARGRERSSRTTRPCARSPRSASAAGPASRSARPGVKYGALLEEWRDHALDAAAGAR